MNPTLDRILLFRAREVLGKVREHALGLSLIITVVVAAFTWIWFDDSVQGGDTPNHLLCALNFHYDFQRICQATDTNFFEKFLLFLNLLGHPVKDGSTVWPNGLYLNAALLFTLFGGPSIFLLKVVQCFYLLLLLVMTYATSVRIHSKRAAILSVFILFSYPLIFESARQYQLDFPLTALVVTIFYLLLANDLFVSRWLSVLTGLTLGYSCHIKIQILFFIGPLLLYKIAQAIGDARQRGGDRLAGSQNRQYDNIVIFGIVSIVIAAIWWIHNLETTRWIVQWLFSTDIPKSETLWLWTERYETKTMFEYFINISASLGWFSLIALLVSLPYFFLGKRKRKREIALIVGSALFVFSLSIIHLQYRYLMPLLPFFALITGSILAEAKPRLRTNLIFVFFFSCCLSGYLILSYVNIEKLGRQLAFLKLYVPTEYHSSPPSSRDETHQVFQEIYADITGKQKTGEGLKIAMLGLNYYFPALLALHGGEVEVYDVLNPFLHYRNSLQTNFPDIRYFIYRPAKAGNDWPDREELQTIIDSEMSPHGQAIIAKGSEALQSIESMLNQFHQQFVFEKRYPSVKDYLEAPYGLYLYKRIEDHSIVPGEKPDSLPKNNVNDEVRNL